MQFLMSPRRVQWLIQYGLWFVPIGILMIWIGMMRLRDVGVVAGAMLAMFGLSTPAYRRWLTDRGLWILATIMIVIWIALYACFQMDAIRRQWKAANPGAVALTIDTGLAMIVVWQQVRFLATIIWVNKAISRSGPPH